MHLKQCKQKPRKVGLIILKKSLHTVVVVVVVVGVVFVVVVVVVIVLGQVLTQRQLFEKQKISRFLVRS